MEGSVLYGEIQPDHKNWTWVLTRPCPDCGFDASTFPCIGVVDALRQNAREWTTILSRPWASQRPFPQQWSALEYGCHVRDVFRLFDQRLRSMLTEDDPIFENWDQDRTAHDEQYGSQEPERVAGEILEASATLADTLRSVKGIQWDRPGRRSDGSSFSVDTLARYLLHDPVHHVWDVERGYERLNARSD